MNVTKTAETLLVTVTLRKCWKVQCKMALMKDKSMGNANISQYKGVKGRQFFIAHIIIITGAIMETCTNEWTTII